MVIVFLCCELVKTFSVLFQNIAYNETVSLIFHSFQQIESFFNRELQFPIAFAPFRKHYRRKVCWALLAYIQLLVFYIIQFTFVDTFDVTSALIKVMQLLQITMYLNIICFVDLLTFCLQHLNAEIRTHVDSYATISARIFLISETSSNRLFCNQISKYKFVHIQLWRTCDMINKLFGWSLISIALQSFMDLTYILYWQIKVLYQEFQFVAVICEFSWTFCNSNEKNKRNLNRWNKSVCRSGN